MKKYILIMCVLFGFWACNTTKHTDNVNSINDSITSEKVVIDPGEQNENNVINNANVHDSLTINQKTNVRYTPKYHFDNSVPGIEVVTKIDFVDNETGVVVNSFDITENNPYHIKNYKDKELWDDKTIRYYINNNLKIKQFIQNFSKYNNINTSSRIEIITVFNAVYLENRNNPIVIYTRHFETKHNATLGIESKALIFDNKGNIRCELKNNTGIVEPIITNDANYVCYLYGYEGHNGVLINSGYQICDLKKNRIIFDYQTKKGSIDLPFVSNNHIIVVEDFGNQEKYLVHDIEQKIVYSKTYHISKISKLVDIKEKGFVFKKNKSNKTTTYIEYFDDSFQKNILK